MWRKLTLRERVLMWLVRKGEDYLDRMHDRPWERGPLPVAERVRQYTN